MKKKTNQLVEELVGELEASVGKIKKIKTFDTNSTKTVLNIAETAVTLVEKYSAHVNALTGREKKKLVVKVLNKYINIPIPKVPRFIMEKIEGLVIGLIVNLVVGFLNKKFGKNWLEDDTSR